MGLLNYIGAAISNLRQRRESKPKTRSGQNHVSRFRIEQLEPRILLSADLIPEAITLIQDQSNLIAPAIVQQLPAESKISVSFDTNPTDNETANSFIQPLVNAAVDQLSGLGFSTEQLDQARQVEIKIVDLAGWTLAEASEDGITIDPDAKGFGWYIDSSPADNSEFVQQGADLQAVAVSEAEGRVDLLSVINHELGHYLGLNHSDGSEAATAFMQSGIRPGIRRLSNPHQFGTLTLALSQRERDLETEGEGNGKVGEGTENGDRVREITEQLIETLRVANGPPLSEALTLSPTISWISNTDGFWDDASNWLDADGVSRVPISSDDVLIDNQDSYFAVTIRSGDQAAHSLCSYQPLNIIGGSLTLTTDSEIYADLTLDDGVLTVNGSLTVYGNLDQNAGIIAGDGVIQASQWFDSTVTEQLSETLDVTDAPLQFDSLEFTPTIFWLTDSDGFWDDPLNWIDISGVSRTPNISDDVLIDGGDVYFSVTIRSGDQAAHSLLANESLNISGGSLTLEADSVIDADLIVDDGILSVNGSLTISGYLVQNGGIITGDGTVQANQWFDSTVTEQLTETLNVANAPPSPILNLPAMELMNDDLSLLNGQVFYLDFDGALGLTYNGPVLVENIDLARFVVPIDVAGQESDLIQTIVASLNDILAVLGVTFTTTQPDAFSDYSTIYVGGDDLAFSQYGSFYGLAEKVDVGNLDQNDIAFVFSEKISQLGMSAETNAAALIEVIDHEARHLLGYKNAQQRVESLAAVAAPATFTTTQGIPEWLAQGPGPIRSEGSINRDAGAIQAILPHSQNPAVIYVGTVNGGVWKTENARNSDGSLNSKLTWTPLTDQFPSLSIRTLAFGPQVVDPNKPIGPDNPQSNVIYAGFGRASAFNDGSGRVTGSVGGQSEGVLKSTDGGKTWALLPETFGGAQITRILNISIGLAPLHRLFVATRDVTNPANGGLWFSDNAGAGFTKLNPGTAGLPARSIVDLVRDPLDTFRLYLSTDDGRTWTHAADGLPAAVVARSV